MGRFTPFLPRGKMNLPRFCPPFSSWLWKGTRKGRALHWASTSALWLLPTRPFGYQNSYGLARDLPAYLVGLPHDYTGLCATPIATRGELRYERRPPEWEAGRGGGEGSDKGVHGRSQS